MTGAVPHVIPDRVSRPIVAEFMAEIPRGWRHDMMRRWHDAWGVDDDWRREGDRRRAANTALRVAAEHVREWPLPLAANADDDDICAKAERMAVRCGTVDVYTAESWAHAIVGAVPESDSEGGVHARLKCPLWWRRALRKNHGRGVEALGRSLELTRRDRHLYVTHEGLYRRRNQRRRNQRLLEELLAVNEDGQEYTVAELAELSVSNPVIRRGELMVRMAGFETIARQSGHVAELWTITCPSRFHTTTREGGRIVRNQKHDGSTTRDAAAYLQRVWASIRAAWSRQGIRPYGFRIAEPHHDGTPHWHLLMFLPRDVAAQAWAIVRRYALAESPGEPGAQKRRCDRVRIDWSRGTACGYVAKYVAKNIDGFGLDKYDAAATEGTFGRDPGAVAERVDAWASIHGIRQFQQIGGPSVTVWRELRRLDYEDSGVLEAARAAADRGDWAAYVRAMGGVDVERKARPVQLVMFGDLNHETGEIPENRYGEPAAGRVMGIEAGGVIHVTRWHTWAVERVRDEAANGGDYLRACGASGGCSRAGNVGRSGKPSGDGADREFLPRSERGGNPQEQARGVSAFFGGGQVDGPRSPVNNCTRGVSDEVRGRDSGVSGAAIRRAFEYGDGQGAVSGGKGRERRQDDERVYRSATGVCGHSGHPGEEAIGGGGDE